MGDDTNGIGYVLTGQRGAQVPTYIVDGVVMSWSTLSTDNVSGSAVQIAPGAFLTAAHVMNGANGAPRDYGTISIGYDAGSSYGKGSITSAVPYEASYDGSMDSTANDVGVFLTGPGTESGTVYAMVPKAPTGPVNISGYPDTAGGTLVTTTERLRSTNGGSVLVGAIIGNGYDPHGMSGGPAWVDGPGGPEVFGVVSNSTTSNTYMAQLTPADIATAMDVLSANHPAENATGLSTDDGLLNLAAVISGDSDSRPRMGAVMGDVASALAQGYADGFNASTSFAAATDMVSWLQVEGPRPARDAAYMAGVDAAIAGAGSGGDALSFIKDTFGGLVSSQATRNAALAGFSEANVAMSITADPTTAGAIIAKHS